MASNQNEKLDPEEEELMRKQMEDLQLQQKRMKSLVDQRRQERLDMEKELLRMERMKKHMEEMCKENDEVLEAERKLEESKKPFFGKGHMLGAPSLAPSQSTNANSRPIVPAPLPVDINPELPITNIQVRTSTGARIVVKLNHNHTIKDLKQQILSQQETEEGKTSFSLIKMGPPPVPLTNDSMTLKEADILGAAVLQRHK